MKQPVAAAERRVRLDFRAHDEVGHADEAVRSDLSSVVAAGRCLWVANDELASVERLVRQDDGGYAGHQTVHLGELFDLPEADGEMDIEGLDIDGGWLWVAGSHSLTRDKPAPGEHDRDAALARLTAVEHHPNRHFVGRMPLVESTGAPGVFDVRRKAARRRSACLKMKKRGGALVNAERIFLRSAEVNFPR